MVVQCTDLAGNVNTSVAYTVVVDNSMSAPTISQIAPDSGTPADFITSATVLTVSGQSRTFSTVPFACMLTVAL